MVSILVLQVYSTAGTGVWRSSVMGSSGPSALFVSFSLPLLFFFLSIYLTALHIKQRGIAMFTVI